MALPISLPNGFSLTEGRPDDRAAYIEWLNDPCFCEVIPIMPYPYTEEAADWWMHHCEERKRRTGIDPTLVIRNPASKLVGVVGSDQLVISSDHKTEFGYWLARPYWGSGLMTAAVQRYIQYAFSTLELERLYAHVLDFNLGSRRVLEKCGFSQEGLLRQHLRTRSGTFDAYLYGLLKTDPR